jgi:hypothetical protein
MDEYPAFMDTLLCGYYAAADSMANHWATDYPGDPAGYYGRAVCFYAHMQDFEDSLGRGQFMAYTDSCIDVVDQRIASANGNKAELAYLKGSALASRGLLLNNEGKLLPGLRTLISARGAFDQSIAADPEYYDSYLGRGAYRYGVAKYASLLAWLPFVPSAESGWKDMWLAVNRSRFSRYFALSGMVWFALEEKRFDLVDSICAIGLTRFPDCRAFLWPRLALLERQRKWSEVEPLADTLLQQYLASSDNNGYETTDLYRLLMVCADSTGRPGEAMDFAKLGLATFRTKEMAVRRHDSLNLMEARLSKQ